MINLWRGYKVSLMTEGELDILKKIQEWEEELSSHDEIYWHYSRSHKLEEQGLRYLISYNAKRLEESLSKRYPEGTIL